MSTSAVPLPGQEMSGGSSHKLRKRDIAARNTASKSGPMAMETDDDKDTPTEGIVFQDVDLKDSYPIEVEDIDIDGEDKDYPIEVEDIDIDGEDKEKPEFKEINPVQADPALRKQLRRIPCPNHRVTPLKAAWADILKPLVEHMKLQVRFNTKKRAVEIRMSKHTDNIGALQKAADFVKAFMMGFETRDAIALLRLEDLFIQSFEVKDVKRLNGDHLARCIGRIAGKGGQTKYAIENSTRTRLVVADSHIHILGSFQNIRLARDALSSLIMGTAPSKVYQHLRTVTKRVQERL